MFRSFAMRAKVWLVVVCIGFVAHHLTVAPAEGRPPGSIAADDVLARLGVVP